MTTGVEDWILWSGTIGLESSIADRIRAASAAGCTTISVSPLDVVRAEVSGESRAALGARIRDAGLGIIMDPVMNWYSGIPSATSRFGRFSTAESLSMCEQVGVTSMSLIAQREGDTSTDAMVEPFAELCDAAASFGADVHLEFIPMTEVPDLVSAWEISRQADRPNGGILVDSWHFFRGSADLELLADIPGHRILAVQLDDAAEHVHGSLWDDTRERLMPGDGSFDLVGLVRVLADIGGLTRVGPEVISTATAAMDPVEAAKRAMERVRTLVTEASTE